MKEDNEESGDKILSRFEISNYLNDNKKDSFLEESNNLSNLKSKDDEVITNFGAFVLLMDNKEEYRKTIINNGKNKVWKAINKIKTSKDINKLVNDPSSTKWYIINPDQNKFKPIFDSLFCLLLYIDFFLSPFEVLVYLSNYKFIRIAIFDIFFAIEIFSNFFISYYDSQNKYYVTDIKKIFINYLKHGFFLNLIYVLPFYLIIKELEPLRFFKIYRYPYVNNKIKRLISWLLSFIIKNITIISQIVRVFTFFLSICYIIHVCACFYCYLGLIYKDSWIYAHSNALDINSILDIYVSSYYFIAETLSSTGYGDLTPNNNGEIAFIMFCEIMNCGLYAYLLSNILDILLNKDNSLSYKFRANQLNLENWIMYYMKKLPASSKKENLHRDNIWEDTKKYYEIYYSPSKNFKWIQEKDFIPQMKPSQRNELMQVCFNHIFTKFNAFFKRINLISSKIKIVMNFQTSIQVSKTVICKNLNNIHKIYFIEKGNIDILKSGKYFFSLTEGNFFGIESILKEDFKKIISYRVNDKCPYVILYTIDIPFLFKEILNYDGESFANIIKWANTYIENILKEKNNSLAIKKTREMVYEMGDYKDNMEMEKNIIKEDNNENNIIDTSNNINNNNSNEKINNGAREEEVDKRKLNLDLIQPGYLPELDKKLAEYQKAKKVVEETKLKIDLINKQINFINKYL